MKRLLILVCFLLLVTTVAMAEKLESWDAVQEKFEQAFSRKEQHLTFTISPVLLKELQADKSGLCRAAAREGYHRLSWTWWSDGKIETTMEPFYCPFRVVQDEDGLIAAVSQMRSARAKDFALVLDPALYTALRKDPKTEAVTLKKGGLYTYGSMYYEDEACVLTYYSCTYWDGAVREAAGETEMLEAIREIGSLGYDAFAIAMDRKTFNSLRASDCRKLTALQTAAFINCGATTYEDVHMLVYRKEGQSVFYPGYVIVQAVQAGRESSLPPRLRETLAKSKKLVSGISGSPKNMVQAIHDLLCRHITYTIDESTEEDDCCIGAILDGKANCDGYSDAFYLLCGLKGIHVRLVMGESIKEGKSKEDNSHMWNLVLLDGKWRGMDVTWDDQESNGIIYEQYNMGMDRMKSLYTFTDTYLPANTLQVTDLQDRPVPEFKVSTTGKVMSAIRKAVSGGKEKIVLWMDDSLYRQYRSSGTMQSWLDLAGASGTDYYNDDIKRVTLCDIRKLDAGIQVLQADSPDDFISKLKQAKGEPSVREIRAYCSDSLYSAYQKNGQVVWKWLDLAGIEATVTHYDNVRMIKLSGIKKLDASILVLEADSSRNLISKLKQNRNSLVREIRAYCSDSLYSAYQKNGQEVWKWLDLAGIEATVTHYDNVRMINLSGIKKLDASILVLEADSSRDLISKLKQNRNSSVREIRAYCSDSLFSAYQKNNQDIWKWLENSGIKNATVYHYTDRKMLQIYTK